MEEDRSKYKIHERPGSSVHEKNTNPTIVSESKTTDVRFRLFFQQSFLPIPILIPSRLSKKKKEKLKNNRENLRYHPKSNPDRGIK